MRFFVTGGMALHQLPDDEPLYIVSVFGLVTDSECKFSKIRPHLRREKGKIAIFYNFFNFFSLKSLLILFLTLNLRLENC